MGDSFAARLGARAAHRTPPQWLIPWITRAHIALYKLTNGRVGSTVAGKPAILVRTIGARSGAFHTVALPYLSYNGDRLVVASFGGGPKNPAWYHNLRAHPDIVVRDRGHVFWAHAEELEGDERAAAWDAIVADSPWYAEYQQRTTRTIPVIRLREIAPYVG